MLGTEPQLRETYVKDGTAKLIFAPVLNHRDRSYQSHQGAECAADQGQFWEFHKVLYENQDALWSGNIQTTIKQLAAEHGLDSEQFNACLDEQHHYDLIFEQDAIRKERGIVGQPVFDINGIVMFGPQPFELFEQAIQTALAE